MKGFKDFIMRGNVMDLAVAVIIGGAFTAIVDALVAGIFNPIIAQLFQADNIANATVSIGAIDLGIGLVIAAVINFFLIAAIVYFCLILPVNALQKRGYQLKHGGPQPRPEAAPTETDLLAEIRDLLKAQRTA
ncbi:large-conductance mechanosensitive channel [Pseudoclavibacter endophyticus]|uniref:Large-conductance mechanosensitive channel n=1 Tax=Pseudoclavibacter endophyticus TaxID=1778590 RepID=A0A6H9WR70_9MICO|nr:large conductance mechanosensitive channel protein MscL [Pseudoclavibacter endophyticus]KAB1649447.1 large conductance mechanosensitive channel protein MscL [Pseudoclavibacter endophyticus]GGA62592.1 large-conductance mechanosensitive channel [Pseudoclavibacter endophyticus]